MRSNKLFALLPLMAVATASIINERDSLPPGPDVEPSISSTLLEMGGPAMSTDAPAAPKPLQPKITGSSTPIPTPTEAGVIGAVPTLPVKPPAPDGGNVAKQVDPPKPLTADQTEEIKKMEKSRVEEKKINLFVWPGATVDQIEEMIYPLGIPLSEYKNVTLSVGGRFVGAENSATIKIENDERRFTLGTGVELAPLGEATYKVNGAENKGDRVNYKIRVSVPEEKKDFECRITRTGHPYPKENKKDKREEEDVSKKDDKKDDKKKEDKPAEGNGLARSRQDRTAFWKIMDGSAMWDRLLHPEKGDAGQDIVIPMEVGAEDQTVQMKCKQTYEK